MFDFWQRALLFPLSMLLVSLLLWGIFGALPATLFFGIVMMLRMIRYLRQLAALEYWSLSPDSRDVPEESGLWEDVFTRLNKMMRKQRDAREKHAAALHQIEQATSALPEGVAILDEADHIEWCNPLAEAHFGLDSVRDVGQQITYLARQPEFVQYLAVANYDAPLILRGTRQDDMVLSVRVVPYGINKKLLISRDITHLERIETMRRDFVANVSHELRTPLTVVNGFVETLQDMKQCLAAGFPFVFGFTVYESFESSQVAQTGQVPMPGPDEKQLGGHAVCCVGYDDVNRLFLVRNSWGADWGMNGYFQISYDFMEALASDWWVIKRTKAE